MTADEIELDNQHHRWLFNRAVHQWNLGRFDFVPERKLRTWGLYDKAGKFAGTLTLAHAGCRLVVDPNWDK